MHKVHKAGIVHRDIKPANIIRSDNGRYYIIDFGIARKPAQSNTQTKIIATLGYASPEQLEGKRATCESDIYSIGRIMKDIMPKSRAYRRIYKKATMDDPQSRYRTARNLANAIRLIPIVRLIITAVILAILFFSLLLLIGGDENGGDFSKTLSESVYGESLTSEELSTEEQRLQSEIANGNDGIDNYICLSGIYENKGDTDKAADVLIEYIDNVYDRRLYLSASPIYQRLENLKAYTTVDKQAEILELNGNADYIDRLLDAGEYERAKQVLDDIKANPCRELVRSKFLQLDDYYYRLYEKTEDYENAASAIFDIYENFYGGTGKLGKDTLYCKNLQSLYDKVSENTQKRIDEICE
jgi:serine/threonine protein kinase